MSKSSTKEIFLKYKTNDTTSFESYFISIQYEFLWLKFCVHFDLLVGIWYRKNFFKKDNNLSLDIEIVVESDSHVIVSGHIKLLSKFESDAFCLAWRI